MKNDQVAREWGRGKYPRSWEIIDIGAGKDPAKGVTRAVDNRPDLFTKSGKLSKEVVAPESLKEYLIFNASNMPYQDEFFERGISRWAIGPKIHGYKPISELYRILKRNGEAYISILDEDKRYIPITVKLLKKAGFKIVGNYIGQLVDPERTVKEHIIHVRK